MDKISFDLAVKNARMNNDMDTLKMLEEVWPSYKPKNTIPVQPQEKNQADEMTLFMEQLKQLMGTLLQENDDLEVKDVLKSLIFQDKSGRVLEEQELPEEIKKILSQLEKMEAEELIDAAPVYQKKCQFH